MTEIVVLKKPQLKDPVLVCGLPGSGYVGKLGVDYLIKEMKAELFAEVYSNTFPPQVVIKQNGSAALIKNDLYFAKRSDSENDLVLYTGDSQPITPEGDYLLAEEVLGMVKQMGAKRVFTLAAYITGAFVEKPRVYATATHKELLKELESYGVQLMKEGSITGMNGLLIGMARIKDMEGICLLGETSGYIIDAKASQAVLEVISKMLKLEIDMSSIAERAKETEAIIKVAEEMRRKGQERPREAERDIGYIS